MNYEDERRCCYDTKIGNICIGSRGDAIVSLRFNAKDCEYPTEEEETAATRKAHRQLTEYLEGVRRNFDLDLKPQGGSLFQRRIWMALLDIPFGHTVSYAQLAVTLGNKNATRAVGGACGKNPIAIFIPCHRVIRSDGSIGGYSGGLAIKEYLLGTEGVHFDGGVCENVG
ncbi:MAG: methylated-DNA--[protein]-cysteine S-methyltransferase, partial [Rickettsiales bacterium]|nr:methylated-DNA--[protein]-cysteine S-methyltransferase [Rickettsiales bacterium]